MKLSRRHHYLPQMYLRGFVDQADLLWVFDRQNNTYLHQGVLNTAVKKDFYSIIGKNGQKTDEVEQMIANVIEDRPLQPVVCGDGIPAVVVHVVGKVGLQAVKQVEVTKYQPNRFGPGPQVDGILLARRPGPRC